METTMGYFKNLAIEMEERMLEVGCEGEDGLLRIHPESETCDVCSPTSIDLFSLAQEDCPQCGGFGYTIEPNGEDGETMVGCDRCSIAHQEHQPQEYLV